MADKVAGGKRSENRAPRQSCQTQSIYKNEENNKIKSLCLVPLLVTIFNAGNLFTENEIKNRIEERNLLDI